MHVLTRLKYASFSLINAIAIRTAATSTVILCLSVVSWGGQFSVPVQYFAGIEPLGPGQTGSVVGGDFNGEERQTWLSLMVILLSAA
jgi:hypothetical protein